MMMVEKFVREGCPGAIKVIHGLTKDVDVPMASDIAGGVTPEHCPETYGYEDMYGDSCPHIFADTEFERVMTCAECWHRQYVEPEEVSADGA